MRLIHRLTVGIVVLLGAASAAFAQRDAADRADRGQRLDSSAFRNDMLQDQLKKPGYPQTWQGASESSAGQTPKPSTRKPKPN